MLIGDGIDSMAHPDMERVRVAIHRARATLYAVNQARFLLADIKPGAHHALDWYEMLDPAARKRIEYLRTYERKLETARDTWRTLWRRPVA